MAHAPHRVSLLLAIVAAAALLVTTAQPAHANTAWAPAQIVRVGDNGDATTPKLSCTLETVTVTTRASTAFNPSIWSRVYYRDTNQQTWYVSRGWAFTSRPLPLAGPLTVWWNANGYYNSGRFQPVLNQSGDRYFVTYYGGTRFTFAKPGGYGSQVHVQVIDYRYRDGAWQYEWVNLGSC